HDSTRADAHSRQDDGVGPNPDVVADRYGNCSVSLEDDGSVRVGPVVLGAQDRGVWSDKNMIADSQPAAPIHIGAGVDMEVPPHAKPVRMRQTRSAVNVTK